MVQANVLKILGWGQSTWFTGYDRIFSGDEKKDEVYERMRTSIEVYKDQVYD